MSETEQKEIEVVTGVIEGVTQKKPDTWQVAVKPEGSQYAKNLWTKDSELVGALSAKLGQAGAFVCSASYWVNQSGTQVRSLWINSLAEEGAHVPAAEPASEGMTPEKWDAKERRDFRSRAWAQAISAMTLTIPSGADADAVFEAVKPLQRKIYEDICGMFAYPPDDDVPF